jgi:hypothetical protein
MIAGAGLDVFNHEPLLANHPLREKAAQQYPGLAARRGFYYRHNACAIECPGDDPMAVKHRMVDDTQKELSLGKACISKPASGGYVDHGIQLVILDRGFVYVGDVKTNNEWCVIAGAKNVRRWGTTRGLGELAAKGPLTDTQLDDTGMVRAPMSAVIALIACNKRKWK